MAFYPIMRRRDRLEGAIDQQAMPTFYMQDYSVLGFRVDDCEQALEILDRHAFSVRRDYGNKGVDIESAERMRVVMQLLEDNGLSCEIADIAEGIYQG
jgi:hypothetical protein